MLVNMKIKKAVIPAAGLGTRFLPVTKSMPKEMLPIIDTPSIHYVIKEAINSGIDDVIIITGRGKRAIEDFYDESPELEMRLKKDKKEDLLKIVKDISSLVNVYYIRQKEPLGLPDAISKAQKHVDDEPFAVLLGDDIIKSDIPCIKQLIDASKRLEFSVIAAQEVPINKISSYGSIDCRKIESNLENDVYVIDDIVEKPKPEDAPSNIAAVGRYVFTPEIFDCINKTKPGVGNELQIADSIKILMESQKVYASTFKGRRYDIGDKFGYIQAIIDFSIENSEIGKNVKEYIKKIIH